MSTQIENVGKILTETEINMGNIGGQQQKLSICEETERKLRNFLTKKNHEHFENIDFVILEGDYVSARIFYFSPKCWHYVRPRIQDFLVEAYYIDEFGEVAIFHPLPSLKKKRDALQLFEAHISPNGVKAIEDSEKIAEKFWKTYLSNQTTEQVRLTLLIEMGLVISSLQHLAKKVILSHCVQLNKLPLPSAMIAYLKQQVQINI